MDIKLLKKRIMETPCMEPVDAVKLVYQNEFGCGHLVTDEAACAAWIAEEIGQTPPDASAAPCTDIGNGLCRLNLRSQCVQSIPAQVIARMMAHAARNISGDRDRFVAKLEALQTACREGCLPFGMKDLEAYLASYAREGYPPVRHSQRYRAAYGPAYRVVQRVYADALPILTLLHRRLARDGRVVVALDGDCAAGKTTMAEALVPLYNAAVIHMDDFFLPPDLRTQERLAMPGGNIHHERFAAEVLGNLRTGEPFTYARFDCQTGARVTREVKPGAVTIVEGSYSHHPAFEPMYAPLRALRVFLTIGEEEQLRRLQKRNPSMLARFQNEWIPLEKTYFQAYDIPRKADVLLSMDTQ